MNANGTYSDAPIITNGAETHRLPVPSTCNCIARDINLAGHVGVFDYTSQAYFYDGSQAWNLASVSDAGPQWTFQSVSGPNDHDTMGVRAINNNDGTLHVLLLTRTNRAAPARSRVRQAMRSWLPSGASPRHFGRPFVGPRPRTASCSRPAEPRSGTRSRSEARSVRVHG